MKMKFLLKLLLAVVFVQGAAFADTLINFASTGNGITLSSQSGGEYLTFSNLYVTGAAGDSANGALVTISPGAGHFYLSSESSNGLTGYFSSNGNATIQIGTSASTGGGMLTGTLSMVELDSNVNGHAPNGNGSFTLYLTLSNLAYHCSAGCTSSALLSSFAAGTTPGSYVDSLVFSFSGKSKVTTLNGLNGSAGVISGTLDSTSAPEPASLALFGSCLMMAGVKLRKKVRSM